MKCKERRRGREVAAPRLASSSSVPAPCPRPAGGNGRGLPAVEAPLGLHPPPRLSGSSAGYPALLIAGGGSERSWCF